MSFSQVTRWLFGAAAVSVLVVPAAQAATCTPTTVPSGLTCSASGLASSGTVAFTGGTLQMNTNAIFSQNLNFTLKGAAPNTIDQDGDTNTFNGIFSNSTGNGAITIANSGTGGSVTFGGANTYTGQTTINAGAKLLLSGTGGLADSNSLADNGTFDISGTSLGAGITSLSGSGTVTLGGQTLTLTKVSDSFSGIIQNGSSGTGGLTLNSASGTETLTNVNTYTGATTITSGTLKLSGSGSIASSSNMIVNDTLDLSAETGTTITTLSGNSSGTVSLGSAGSLSLSNASGTFAGAITGSTLGSALTVEHGKEILSGANTYNGITNVNSGATLQLDGSVTSSVVVNSGGLFSGAGTIGGTGHDLTDAGTVEPGDPVLSTGSLILTVGHNYTQDTGGTLDIQIGSTVAGGLYGVLQVKNLATLDTGSVLNVQLDNFAFGLGNSGTYNILDFKTLTGGTGFTSLEFGGTPCSADGVKKWACDDGSLIVSEIITSGDIGLQFDSLPEPGTLAILAAGLGGLGWTRRRFRRA